ncbi:MAG: DUF2089 domain-containing protein [Lachnospiraceae bacterium]|nr:DUF2089 domain-containing protein [Lachnospiraceae bacterium]MCI9203573.1 DUF2089 domain-containing protein [Lachnospiraceae bacterium]
MCERTRTGVSMRIFPQWLTELTDEDLQFIRRFVLASGSLKEVAKIYGVTYPTVRSRLDRVISQILSSDEKKEEAYISLIKKMVLEEKLEFDAAAILIQEYRKEKENDEQ